MRGDRPPLSILRLGGVEFAKRRDTAVTFQRPEVGSEERRLKDAAIARDGVEQGLEFRQLFQQSALFDAKPHYIVSWRLSDGRFE
jgi:hypothetical protein